MKTFLALLIGAVLGVIVGLVTFPAIGAEADCGPYQSYTEVMKAIEGTDGGVIVVADFQGNDVRSFMTLVTAKYGEAPDELVNAERILVIGFRDHPEVNNIGWLTSGCVHNVIAVPSEDIQEMLQQMPKQAWNDLLDRAYGAVADIFRTHRFGEPRH